MGGSVPSQTSSQTFQAYTPNALDWANFKLAKEKQKLQMDYYRPLLADALAKRDLYKGVMQGNPDALRQFAGYGAGTSPETVMQAINIKKGLGGGTPTTSQKAATGGIMQARKFATGGLTKAQSSYLQEVSRIVSQGGTLTQAQIDKLNKIETTTGKPVSPYIDTGKGTLGNKDNAAAAEALQKAYTAAQNKNTLTDPNSTAKTPFSYLDTLGSTYGVVPGTTTDAAGNVIPDPTKPVTFTDPNVIAVLDQYKNLQTPAEFGQASAAYNALTGYKAPTVSAQKATAGTSSAQQAQAQQMGKVADVTAPELQYFQADRGGIRDVAPSEAQAYGYDAATMQAPEGIAALGYDAAEMQAAQMDRAAVRDINAQLADVERYNASLMNAPADIQAQAYRAAQAQGNQMDMPSSWTEAGTAEKYMNPYIQNVVDIEKREALRDYEKQLNALNSQAVGAKAYGGSRLAIERSEAARNQAMKMADIEAKGLNEAYQQGIGQFATEQGQGLQAGQANLTAAQQTELANQQALNSQRSQYVTQALQAAQNNYGGKLTAAQQNQIAQNAAAQFNAQSQNTAYNNYVAQQLAAQQANQQMDFGVGQLNTQMEQQANATNQAAINAQRSQYVTQALQAAQNNYGGQLTAAQQNQIAQNAASQFEAQAKGQTSQFNSAQAMAAQQLNQGMDAQTVMANLQANLGVDAAQAGLIMQGALANQQTAYNTGALNAQLGTNVSLQNAQLGTQVGIANAGNITQTGIANASNALQAGIASQQGDIAAAGVRTGAAQGLGSIGSQIGNFDLNKLNAGLGIANASMGLGQQWFDTDAARNAAVAGGAQMPGQAPS